MKKLFIIGLMLCVTTLAFGQTKPINPTIGGKADGATITKSELVSVGKISLSQATKQVNFFMISYTIKAQRYELSSNSNLLTAEMKTAINSLPSGTRVQFIKISCKPINNQNAAPERVGEFTLTVQ